MTDGLPAIARSLEGRVLFALVDLADTLADDYDEKALCLRLARYCVSLTGVSAAGVSRDEPGGGLGFAAASDEHARRLELLQLRTGRGPALDVRRTGELLRVNDAQTGRARWPEFTSVAIGAGFRTITAMPLRRRDQIIGTLTLYDSRPGPPTEPDLVVTRALADVTAVGVLRERVVRREATLVGQLQEALDSRIVIEQAKGLLLAYADDSSAEEAFERLRAYSRKHGRRLRDVAGEVVSRVISPSHILNPDRSAPSTDRTRN